MCVCGGVSVPTIESKFRIFMFAKVFVFFGDFEAKKSNCLRIPRNTQMTHYCLSILGEGM
jgi:hypothetical protein